MKTKNTGKKKKQHFNDLLLPIVAVLCIMPFTVYLAEYDYGYSGYLWHSDNSIMQEFYAYYRSIFFLVILFFVLVVLAFRFAIDREHIRKSKAFLPLLAYVLLALLSGLCSDNLKAAFRGNYVSFQGFFVLAGYCLIAYYTYQMMRQESDYRSILHAVMVMFVPMSIIGWLQVGKMDLLNLDWVQKMFMPDALYEAYGGMVEDTFTGNNVFLTLYNPNYAAIFLVMFSCVFLIQFLMTQEKREKIVTAVFLADSLALCWFTYTRAALLAFAVVLLLLVSMEKKNRKNMLAAAGAGALLLILLFVVDAAVFQGKFAGRIIDEPKSDKLEAVLTTEEGVEIAYDGTTYILNREAVSDGEIRLPFSGECYADLLEWDGEELLIVQLDDISLQFVEREDSYYYYTEWGKTDSLVEIPAADFHGYEYLGSGRLYIWSRVLPMLKHYLFLGSGPDTFAEVYPQNDYIGKAVYAENPGRVMEGAHNAYLMQWVQTGLLSLLALLVFYGVLVKKCFSYYKKCGMEALQQGSMRDKLGFGCFLGCVGYLVCSFFSDYSLYTTPVFFVFAGIALAAVSAEE